MESLSKKILITGGAGFIGSHVVRLFVKKYPQYAITNLDKLTYAGNLENIKDIEKEPNYRFVKMDITDERSVRELFQQENFDGVIHLAAASHVDRSLHDPYEFIHTNITGTAHLLQAALKTWGTNTSKLFYHISTDEVYGSLEKESPAFTEKTPIDPHSPYSASKAGSDQFVQVFHSCYRLPTIISRCSNNYGPYQFPEKLIPLMIHNIINSKPLPVYGRGENIRDWLYVEDHVRAIDLIFHNGKIGEVYNIGGDNEWQNMELVQLLCTIMDKKMGKKSGHSAQQIQLVKDRPGHDFRYAINSSKLHNTLGWQASLSFEKGLENTVDWYLANRTWCDRATSGAYRTYYEKMYQH